MALISAASSSPLLDARQSESAMRVRRGLQRFYFDQRCATLPEMTLANGRRADLCVLSAKGKITIVEIKSSVEDFLSDSKWQDYAEFCDAFYFATHPDVPQDIFPEAEGLIVADNYGAEVLRPAMETPLPAARRKALTQRFATCAAERLLQAEWSAQLNSL